MTKNVKYVVYSSVYDKACHVQYIFIFKDEVDVDENVQTVSPQVLLQLCSKNVIEHIISKLIFYNGENYDEVIHEIYPNDLFYDIFKMPTDKQEAELAFKLSAMAEIDAEKWIDSYELNETDYEIIKRLENIYKEKGMEEIYKIMWHLRQGIKVSVPTTIDLYLKNKGY